jgi:imidazoleglycerol-phosphate dehydratase
MRNATVERKTKETEVRIELTIDGRGAAEVETSIGFLDHMLEHIAVHGLFDLNVKTRGDTHVDLHHTVEDTALALGEAFDRALGDRSGLVRIGHAVVPMDETLALAAVDFSGRPHCLVRAEAMFKAFGRALDRATQIDPRRAGGIPSTKGII